MARGNMNVWVVDVGQGQCTYVEIWNTANSKIQEVLLFDCGSDSYSLNTFSNLQNIVDRMVLNMTKPVFSCIFFSHSDSDHISLTKALLERFPSAKKPKVELVWFGGNHFDYYKKIPGNILTDLVTDGYCKYNDVCSPESPYSGYKAGAPNEYLWTSSENSVQVFCLIGNVLTASKAKPVVTGAKKRRTGEPANRVSLVCGLYYRGKSFVICGDATNKTMAAVNDTFKGGTTTFNNNVMTTIPHHGSRNTGFAVASTAIASPKNIKVVTDFAKLLKSETLSVSAYGLHLHPSMQLMNEFIPTKTTPIIRDSRLKGPNNHLLNGYQDIKLKFSPSGKKVKEDYLIFETQTNTFSTKYNEITFGNTEPAAFNFNLGDPTAKVALGVKSKTIPINPFACWLFQIKSSNLKSSIEGYSELGKSKFTNVATTTTTAIKAKSVNSDTEEILAESSENSNLAPDLTPPVSKVRIGKRNSNQGLGRVLINQQFTKKKHIII